MRAFLNFIRFAICDKRMFDVSKVKMKDKTLFSIKYRATKALIPVEVET
jgi:hypothetical protein